MAIEFQCPACHSTLSVPDNAADQKGRCPQCRQKIRVPKVPESAARPAATLAIEFRCPRCQVVIRTPAETAGQKGYCPQCQGKIRVPQTQAAAVASAPSAAVNDATFFGLGKLTAPATEGEQFLEGIDLAAETSSKKMLRSRNQGKWIGIVFPVVTVGLLGLVGAYLLGVFTEKLGGSLPGIELAEPELPPITADATFFGRFGPQIQRLERCLETDPVLLKSDLLSLVITAKKTTFRVQVRAEEGMSIYRVSIQDHAELKKYAAREQAALNAPRDELVRKSAGNFVQAVAQRCRRADGTSEGLVQYRNPIGLAACVEGLGYHLQAIVAGEGFPCCRQDEGALYFVLPKGLKAFEVGPREVPDSRVRIPGKFTVEVQKARAAKPK